MKRRDFITLLGGAVAWPLAARAQQPMPVVGLLLGSSAAVLGPQIAAFHEGLRQAGFAEGRNVAVQYRYTEGQLDRFPALASELVDRGVAVIVAGTPTGALAAKQATRTIPIVFTIGSDPVEMGLVASLNSPRRQPDRRLSILRWARAKTAGASQRVGSQGHHHRGADPHQLLRRRNAGTRRAGGRGPTWCPAPHHSHQRRKRF